MEYGGTAHNRTVYAAPAVTGLASIRLGQSLRSFPRLIPAHCPPPQCYALLYRGRATSYTAGTLCETPHKFVRNGGIRAAVDESINKEKQPLLDFNKCQPIELDDLIRVGNKYDVGYILSKRQIKNTDTVLSFGINLDWTFEEEFFYNKNVKIYSYDNSTKAYLEKNIFGIIYRFFIQAPLFCIFLFGENPLAQKTFYGDFV
jgi:hypothetical protein